jgi:hypothetical protein
MAYLKQGIWNTCGTVARTAAGKLASGATMNMVSLITEISTVYFRNIHIFICHVCNECIQFGDKLRTS